MDTLRAIEDIDGIRIELKRDNRKPLPSVKTLEQAFPSKGKAVRRLLESSKAVREHPAAIARERECYNPPTLQDLRMTAINAEVGGFGVEYARAASASKKGFEYINTGDSYSLTLVRFHGGTYRVTTWGDIVERGGYV